MPCYQNDPLARMLESADYYILASNFRGKHATCFKSNAPALFKISYTFNSMFRVDPIIADVRTRQGWASWSKEYDITQPAFAHCTKHGMDASRGHSFFFRLGGEHALASLILKPHVVMGDSLRDNLAHDIIYLSESLFLREEAELDLTETQIHILMLIHQGLKEKQIAHELNVSLKTVQTHKRGIERRLNVDNFHQAIIKATKAGIFD